MSPQSESNYSAYENLNKIQIIRIFYERAENIVRKKEKYWLPAFSPFPLCFQSPCSLGLMNVGIVYELWFNPLLHNPAFEEKGF